MEIFQNFSGGLNTVAPPDTMLDTELTDILNMDLSDRGTLKRRIGMKKIQSPRFGDIQGYFRYYKTDGTFEHIWVIDGYVYRNEEVNPIVFNPRVQTTDTVDGFQYGGTLYLITGSQLMGYDGTTLAPVDPYLPTTQEMTFIGTNALATDPEAHLQDSIGLVPSIDYVYPVKTTLYVGTDILARVFITSITGETYEFATQIRGSSLKDSDWPDTSTLTFRQRNPDNSVFLPTRSVEGEYEYRVVMRKVGTTDLLADYRGSFTVTQLQVREETDSNAVSKCNRGFWYQGRMYLYGNPDSPATVYMSHLNTPNYVPSLYNLEFDNPRREPITQILQYRNSLVIFTKTSVQALYGTGPDDYRRVMLHTDLGCIAENGAAVMQNHIAFVSYQGIYALKTLGLTDDKATVERLDTNIANIVPNDTNVLVAYHENQLHVTFPTQKVRFRYYELLKAWTKDYSDNFILRGMKVVDGDLFAYKNLALYQFDSTVFDDDDYNYENYFESKYLSFGQPYHQKKLKELQILTAPNDESMNCTIYVYADEQAVITPDHSYASVVDGVVVWNVSIEPNFHVSPGAKYDDNMILGDSVFGENLFDKEKLPLTGKCLRTRVKISNNEPKENHFIGFAYVFKTRKP
jgi:hypothetical protein